MSAEKSTGTGITESIPTSAIIELRNEFAASANQKGQLVRLLIGKLAIPAEDAQVSYALGSQQTFTDVVHALDAMFAAQNADQDLIELTEVASDPNIDRLEDL
jgi:hypothetical protein